MKKHLLHGLAALSLSMASFGAAAEKVTLMLDWFVNPNHGPIILAQEKDGLPSKGLRLKSRNLPILAFRISWSLQAKLIWLSLIKVP